MSATTLQRLLPERTPTPLHSMSARADERRFETSLSDFQTGLYFVQRLAPDSAAYNLIFCARILSPLNYELFAGCVQTLIDRHACLRASYDATEEGEPRQYVNVSVAADCVVSDMTEATAEILHETILQESRRPFALAKPPLLRARLYRCAERRHILLLTAHHIAVDFWSLAILLDELRLLYTALERRVMPSLPKKNADYADFIAWQQQALAGDNGHRLWEYWRQQLTGAPSTLNLPVAHAPLQTGCRAASVGFCLKAGVTAELRKRAMEEGATLYMLLLAAYQTLLYRYTAQEDIVVGSPVSLRTRPEFRAVVGNFTNLIVLRGAPQGRKSFRTFLREIRECVIEGVRHQDYPFARLVEKLAPERPASRSPLIQASFAWERLPQFRDLSQFFTPGGTGEKIQFGAFELEPYVLPQQEGQFDITLEMGAEINGELSGVLKYDADLFDAPFISAMTEHFRTLLEGIAADADCALSRLPMLTEQENRRLLWDGNHNRRDYGGPRCAHALFEAQAARCPDSTAVSCGEQSLSYAELNRRANQVAHYLRHLGLGRGARIGICMERGLSMVIALLGTLKAGACYVPLDPLFPPKRLVMAIEDACPALVLTGGDQPPIALGRAPCLSLERDFDQITVFPTDNPTAQVTENELAYIIFTSGSTGRPKGVQIPHGAVVNFLRAMAERPGLAANDVLLSVTTLSFDIAVLELFLPLAVGARAVLVDRDTAVDPKRLEQALQHCRATIMQATPATWRMLLTAGCSLPPGLTMLCGGEHLPRPLAEQLLAQGGTLWNMYGPTETTVWSTAHKVESGEGEIPLGEPIANTRLYVLDPCQQPVPVGVPGELYIGGAGVALGYLDRPELTSERFVAIPWLEPDGELLYRTGDRVCYRADGKLYYLGRFGNQVKVRGYRIELGDIETHLGEHPQINAAVVALQGSAEGGSLLTAFYQLRPGHTPPAGAALRQFLEERLPSYMIPAHFVALETFPLTPNGKVDRLALQEQRSWSAGARRDYVAPRDAMEITLVRLFEQLLELQPVGVTDDFFQRGGHSLLAVRLIAEIKQQFGIDLPLAQLLNHPTVEALAAILRQAPQSDTSIVIQLRAGADDTPLFLMHPIGGTVFCYLALARRASWNSAIYAIQAPSLSLAEEPLICVEEMAARYIEAIQAQQPQGPYYLSGWCFGGVVAFEIARQLVAAGQSVALLALLDSRAPIPENAPPEGDDALLLSWFARDLATPYGKTLSIPPAELRAAPNQDKLGYVLARAQEIGVLPPEADCALLERYFELYLANGMALQIYAPGPYSGRVALLRARDETADYGADLGWSRLVSGPLDVKLVPGDHNSLMYEPQIAAVAAELNLLLKHLSNSVQVNG